MRQNMAAIVYAILAGSCIIASSVCFATLSAPTAVTPTGITYRADDWLWFVAWSLALVGIGMAVVACVVARLPHIPPLQRAGAARGFPVVPEPVGRGPGR